MAAPPANDNEMALKTILGADLDVRQTRLALQEAKDVMKEAKENYSAAMNRREELLGEAREGLPLLDAAKNKGKGKAKGETPAK